MLQFYIVIVILVSQLLYANNKNTNTKHKPCFPIHTIRFSSIEKQNIDKVIRSTLHFVTTLSKPYTNQCLHANDIATLLKSLNDTAITKGYATTRFGIGAQDIKNGLLDIAVQLGMVGNIQYNHNKYMPFYKKDFSTKQGDILYLKALENGISNISRIKYLNTTMKIIPTDTQNFSDVVIDITKKTKPFYTQFIFDNGGTTFDGYQHTLLLNYENPFYLADILTFYMFSSIPFNGLNIKHNYSLYSSISYSVPIRRFLIDMNFSYARNILQIPLANTTVKYRSDNFNFDNKLSYTLFRNPKHTISISSAFGGRMSNSFIDNIELIIQRQKLLQYIASLNYALTLDTYKFNISMSVLHGFALANEVVEGFNFVVPVINLYAYTPFRIKKFLITYTTTIKTQIAQSKLYANDQMAIGGRYTVRGFSGLSFSGQFGVLYRNDLSFYFPLLKTYNLTLAPSIGIDCGYVKDLFDINYSNLPRSGIFLSGGGLGLQIISRYVTPQIWWYFPFYSLYRSDTQSFFFSIGINY